MSDGVRRQVRHSAVKAVQMADGWIARIEDVFMYGTAAALGATMFIITADVVQRYAFNAPLTFTYDLISRYLMPAAFFLTLAQAMRRNEHVGVDLLVRRMAVRSRCALTLVVYFPTALFFAAVFYLGTLTTWDAWIEGDVLGGLIPWPMWASAIFVPIGSGLIFVRIVHRLAACIVGVLYPDAPVSGVFDVILDKDVLE